MVSEDVGQANTNPKNFKAMAFLASATHTFSSSFTPSLFSAKTDQILDNSKRNERFKVSCKSTDGDRITRNARPESSIETSVISKLDRRNMLLGLGGLYGVANMMGDQSALADRFGTGEPVPYPDPTKCSTAYITGNPSDPTNKPVPYSCCPQVPLSEIQPYKFPDTKVQRVRQAAHLVDDKYIEKYMKAIQAMKDLKNDDPISFSQQANVHCAYCNYGYPTGVKGDDGKEILLQVHASWLFLPFHRWYLYFFEKIAGTLIDDPTFALPFWNWDAPCGMTIPYMFVPEKSPLDSSKPNPLYDEYRNPDNLPPAVVDFNQSRNPEYIAPDIQKVCNNLTVMYRQMVTNGFNASSFMGKPYYFGSKPDPGKGSLETSPHDLVHAWTGVPRGQGLGNGEDMGNFYSAGKDPIFYCHHANVDRLWTIWLTLGGRRRNFRQKAWLDSKFFFYDENRNPVYVTVRDCLDNKEKLGYTYQPLELPWRLAKPIPKKPKSREAKEFRASTVANVFPAKLDKVIKVSVQRSKKNRTKEKKEAQEEILVIEGIELPSDEYVRFDVFINDDDEKGLVLSKAEFAGTFANVPHGSGNSGHPMSTDMTIGLNEILEDLESEDDEYILVTLIPKSGCDNVIVDNIKIDFEE